jgi:hypothetical protein
LNDSENVKGLLIGLLALKSDENRFLNPRTAYDIAKGVV